MAHSKRNSVIKFKAAAAHVSSQSSDLAKRLFDHFLATGKRTEHQAWVLAGRLLDPTYADNYDLATISQVDYPATPGHEAMITKSKDKRASNGAANGHSPKLTRKRMPTGPGWEERIARGLRRWREARGLSIPEAAKEYEVDQQIWYGIEGGDKPQKTGANLNLLCQKIGVDNIELQKLGMNP